MKVIFDPGVSSLELRFDELERLRSFIDEARERRHFYLSLDAPAKPLAEVDVRLFQGGLRTSFRARVVQVFRSGSSGHGTAFQVLEPETLEVTEPEAEVEASVGAPGEEKDEREKLGETLGSSPIFRIRQLNISEKMHLATRAGRTERQILIRDPSPQVHMGLLANPHLEESEVQELVKSSRASSGVLQRIAKDPKLAANYEIRLALVKHPQTPTPLAVSLLPRLHRRDLGALAKSSSLRESVKGPALRLYLQQT